MAKAKGVVSINNEVTDPTGEYVISYLFGQTKETAFYDFKWFIDASKHSREFPKIIKDVYAFSNQGGGWIVLGVKENDGMNAKIKGKFIKTGIPDEYRLDDAILQEKINKYLDEPISPQYVEFTRTINNSEKIFALIYFPPSSKLMIPKTDIKYKNNGKVKIVVLKNTVYTRRGTQSIPASDYEKTLIRKRLKSEKYRLSIISGEPDMSTELLYSNLFEVKQIPQTIYLGIAKYSSFFDTIQALRITYPNMHFFPLNYRTYKNQIVTLDDLTKSSIHREIVEPSGIRLECVANWLKNPDQKNIIIGLLNKAVIEAAKCQGLQYDKLTRKLYYAIKRGADQRKEDWPTRYRGVRKKLVAKKIWPNKQTPAYLHAAIRLNILDIDNCLYLKINPTMIITSDGLTPVHETQSGALITGHTYRIYNKQQLNNLLFWINKLGNGNEFIAASNFKISNTPVQTNLDVGISWDMPTSDLKQIIENFDEKSNDDYEPIVGEGGFGN